MEGVERRVRYAFTKRGDMMGIFSRFKHKEESEPLPVSPTPETKPEISSETTTIENLKAKMDLILTELDSLRTQYSALSNRIEKMEKMIEEIYKIAQS